MWKRLLHDDFTILTLVSIMTFFDAGTPDLQEYEKIYCKERFRYYSKLLERYCLSKLMPIAYIDILFNFGSITAKRQHSDLFIKKLSTKLELLGKNKFFAEMNDSWFRHVDR